MKNKQFQFSHFNMTFNPNLELGYMFALPPVTETPLNPSFLKNSWYLSILSFLSITRGALAITSYISSSASTSFPQNNLSMKSVFL